MADFRKYVLAFSGLACMFGLTGTASAQFGQNFSCTANASTPFDMRAQGITEQAGDFVLTCTGGTPTPQGVQIPQVNITVSLNTQLTSRLISGSNQTDALLLINEPPAGSQTLCPIGTVCPQASPSGNGGGAVPLFGTNEYRTILNTFNGVLVAPNSVTFFGVPIDPPGGAGSNTIITPVLTLRITNIRANASTLGAPTGFATSNVFETISTSANFPITGLTQNVGVVRNGLTGVSVSRGSTLAGTGNNTFVSTSSSAAASLQQCTSSSLISGLVAPTVEQINFSEGFATATKTQFPIGVNQAFQNPNAESQTAFNGAYTNGFGGADYATRIQLTFNNVPAGVTIYVPTSINATAATNVNGAPSTTMRLTSTASGAFSGVSASSTTNLPSNFAALTVTTGSAVAVYEVSTQALNAAGVPQAQFLTEAFQVPVIATSTASPSTNSPGLGTTTVNVDFAPLSTVTTASASFIPRFVPSSTAQNGFTINACSTVLLFPFVSNIAGFDTGLAVSNTSTDPFGTAPQTGTCTLSFFGSGSPAAFTTPTIASGTVYTNLASNVAAGFQGYMIARCGFQYAHGFAFITDGFGGPGRGLSQGYLPLVIPDISGGRAASSTDKALPGAGESLTQ